MSLKNRRKDFSQKPPKTPIIPGVLSVIDTPSINLTFNNSTQELQADLQSIISPGTYGSPTLIPVFTVNSFGQIISITEVPASGGGSPYTVSNGLTENPVNNFQLGGTLIQPTVLTAGAFATPGNRLRFDALSLNNVGAFYFTALTSPSYTVNDILSLFWSIGATSLKVVSDNLYGGLSSYGLWLEARNAGATGLYLETKDLSATPLHARNSAAGYDLMFLRSDGEFELPRYGTGIFSGTPAYALGVDASGNVVEFTPGGGSFVPTTRNITINGVTQDLSADRTWTIPTVPPESVYPYIKNQYFRVLDMSCGQYANNLLFLGGNLQNQVIVVNTQTGEPVTTTAFDRPIAASKITSLGTPESWTTSNTITTVCRHNLTTGAFIATTALTGVVTNAQNSKFVDFNSTKTIGHNLTQIYNVNPSTFVTTNLTTHGLGSFCMSALNTNGASAQNGVLMLGGANGIVLYDCNTSTITLAATTLSGIIGPVQDIIYIPSLDTYAVYTTLSGNQRIVYLQVTGATTFTQTLSIANLSNFNVSLTYPSAQVRFKMFADVAVNELFVMVNNRLSVFNLTTGALLKSDLYSSFGAGNFPIVADIDTSNNRLFFSTGGTSPSTVFELIYT